MGKIENKAIFMLGLPGGGKSTWIENFQIQNEGFHVISADEIRVNHERYDPKHPEAIHEECIKIAEHRMYRNADCDVNLIMDGGGINNNYTVRIIKFLKERDYHITVVFINTPAEICLQRNKERIAKGERFVPASDIIKKAYKLNEQIAKLKPLVDEFISVDHFTDKHVFVDMDGTVAEYQELIKDEEGNINFVEYEVFRYAKPVKEVISRLKALAENGSEIYITSASPNTIANREKLEWLKEHMSFLKDDNIYFVGNIAFKTVFIGQLIHKLKLNPKDCLFVDDEHAILEKAKNLSIHAIHPSKLLTYYSESINQ